MADQTPIYRIPIGGGIRLVRIAEGVHDLRTESHVSGPDQWFFHLYSYEAKLAINGQSLSIRPGFAGILPPGAAVTYQRYGPSTHLFASFTCHDADSEPVVVPALMDLGERFAWFCERFESAIQFFATQPARAQTRICDILWDLAQPATSTGAVYERVPNAIVIKACRFIEQAMHRPLTVTRIAHEVRISRDHLARLFRQHLGTTVLAYLRQRRSLRARHLLGHSLLPLKSIAAQVGIPDPHLFNKTVRRELGASPSQVRRQAIAEQAGASTSAAAGRGRR